MSKILTVKDAIATSKRLAATLDQRGEDIAAIAANGVDLAAVDAKVREELWSSLDGFDLMIELVRAVR